MRYIAIVDKLPDEFEEGSYSRLNESNFIHSATSKLPISPFTKKGLANAATVAKVTTVPILAVPSLLKGKIESKALSRINEIEEALVSSTSDFLFKENYNAFFRSDENRNDWNLGGIILTNESLKGNYSLEPKSLFSKLLDCIPNFSSDVLRKLMQSDGGSELIMIERNKVPKSFHVSNELEVFSKGIYIIHPKFSNKLIPLKTSEFTHQKNAIELLREIIIDEMITILMYLGAKRIVIMEVVGKKASTALSLKDIDIGGNFNDNLSTLREIEFGESPIDLERARKAVLFTADLAGFKTIFQGREYSNKTRYVFKEMVDVSLGIDVSVIKVINPVSISGSKKRYWSMEIDFYDKNVLEKTSRKSNSNWLKKLF